MKNYLITYLLLTMLFYGIFSKLNFSLATNLPLINVVIQNKTGFTKKINVLISTYMNESVINYHLMKGLCSGDNQFNYFYFIYNYCKENEERKDHYYLNYTEINEKLLFYTVNFKEFSYVFNGVLSLNNISDSLFIILNYTEKSLIIDKNMNFEENKLFQDKNICNNNSLIGDDNKKRFFCKLDYILFGHEDIAEDDVYLAKEIKDPNPYAYFDNFLTFCIFPEKYLDYFFSSFFSELNDGCEKKSVKLEDTDVEKREFFYITCPKSKIDIYTKRRKLSVIFNKFSYKISNLFSDSLIFVVDINNDNYYFNIVFEKERNDFILGMNVFNNLTIGSYNNLTYLSSNNRTDYTSALTDINSESFEKWVYILTASSFTLVLVFFTIIGCIHRRKVNKELREMLNY